MPSFSYISSQIICSFLLILSPSSFSSCISLDFSWTCTNSFPDTKFLEEGHKPLYCLLLSQNLIRSSQRMLAYLWSQGLNVQLKQKAGLVIVSTSIIRDIGAVQLENRALLCIEPRYLIEPCQYHVWLLLLIITTTFLCLLQNLELAVHGISHQATNTGGV
nr:uncharacterized protein LOC113709209 [Coffea arabica]